MCYTGRKYVSVVDVFHTASAGTASCCKRAATILQKTLSEMTELLGSLQLACFVQPYIQTTEENTGNAVKGLGVLHPRSSLVVSERTEAFPAALSLYGV